MATVPGDPDENVVQMMPKWAQPTAADFLQAAAIMHEKGRFQMAGEVVPMPGPKPPMNLQELEAMKDKQRKIRTEQTLIRAGVGKSNVLQMTPGDNE